MNFEDVTVAFLFTSPHYRNIPFLRGLYPFPSLAFYDAGVFLELAVPHAVMAASSAGERGALDGVGHCRFQHGTDDRASLYRPHLHGIHRVKFSSQQDRERARSLLTGAG